MEALGRFKVARQSTDILTFSPLLKVFDAEMSQFFTLFNRFLALRAKGEKL